MTAQLTRRCIQDVAKLPIPLKPRVGVSSLRCSSEIDVVFLVQAFVPVQGSALPFSMIPRGC
uniref:Uncharacterized protein n=1 Tax=Bradyrhizobium amphicarpaeae TaxID=1404768 RepID=A0A2U8PU42_9BRAD|nr:hypothetical protein CIT40_15885 [Bradyrhizobium amphicarpaeae]